MLIDCNLFDKMKPCIKQDDGTCLFLRATCQSYLISSSYSIMKIEWTEDHDIQLNKKMLVSEPYRFKPRATCRLDLYQP